MDLFRARDCARVGPERRHGRLAHSSLGRITGATDATEDRREFPGAARSAHAALRGARGGPIRTLALVARRRKQGHTTRQLGPRPIHVGGGQPRRPARGRHRGEAHRQPVARAAARSARRGFAMSNRIRLPTARALAPRFGGKSLFYLSSRGTGDGLWRMLGRAGVRGPAGRGRSRCPSRPRSRRMAARGRRRSERRGNSTWRSCRQTARTHGRWPRRSTSRGTGRLVAGRHMDRGRAAATRRVRRLFKIPVDGGAPVRLVGGQAASPVWSPDGKLIVYAGPLEAGEVPLLGVRPDGAPVQLPPVQARPGGYRFLPNGTGLVYLVGERTIAELLAARSRPRRPPVSSLASAIKAIYGRSTSRRMGNTSCSTARERTRTSS